jgi:hypothetical protein
MIELGCEVMLVDKRACTWSRWRFKASVFDLLIVGRG